MDRKRYLCRAASLSLVALPTDRANRPDTELKLEMQWVDIERIPARLV